MLCRSTPYLQQQQLLLLLLLSSGQSTRGLPSATLVTTPSASWNSAQTIDFSSTLLFPHAPIQSASVQLMGNAPASGNTLPPVPIVAPLPNGGLTVKVYAPFPGPAYDGGFYLVVSADQSAHSSVSKA